MNFKKKIKNYIRVLKITKKPTKEEFWTSAKISALGITIIGFIGFLIYVIAKLLQGM